MYVLKVLYCVDVVEGHAPLLYCVDVVELANACFREINLTLASLPASKTLLLVMRPPHRWLIVDGWTKNANTILRYCNLLLNLEWWTMRLTFWKGRLRWRNIHIEIGTTMQETLKYCTYYNTSTRLTHSRIVCLLKKLALKQRIRTVEKYNLILRRVCTKGSLISAVLVQV